MVQWLRFCASTAGGARLIPGQGTKILHAVRRGQKKKKSSHLQGSLEEERRKIGGVPILRRIEVELEATALPPYKAFLLR